MKNEIPVSVIIPAYNQSDYLATAIESVLNQTYDNVEIIIVDDGSTDDTPVVIKTFEEKIRCLRQENQGLAGARNTGIRNASNRLICLLDADDEWQPQYLEKMVALYREDSGAAIYYCCAQAIDKDGKKLPQIFGCHTKQPSDLLDVLLRANFLIPSTVMMNYSTIAPEEFFDVNFRRIQDRELWIRLLRQGYYFRGLSEVLVNYRIHGESLSVDAGGGQQAAMALVVKHFGIDDGKPELWPPQKRRAYGGTYRYHLLSSVQRQNNWEDGALYFKKALSADPTLASDLDLFYELALGTQPMGYRGSDEKTDIEGNASKIIGLLDEVFQDTDTQLRTLMHLTYGMACYAIGLTAYNTGRIEFGRRYLGLAGKFHPELVFSSNLAGIWLKSFLGNGLLVKLRHLKPL